MYTTSHIMYITSHITYTISTFFTYIAHVFQVNLSKLLFYMMGGGKWCSLLRCSKAESISYGS